MKQYKELVAHVLNTGNKKSDRTGTGTISVFGYQMRFDLSLGFPLLTTKKMFTKGMIAELLWFLEGSTDERRLAEIQYGDVRENLIGKTTIWTANAENQGKALGYLNTDTQKKLGPIYGYNWRSWVGADGKVHDQISDVIHQIKTNPNSRRLVVSAWNVPEIDSMALPPCHALFQFYVNDGKLSCQLYQRSADIGLGVPFNIASYSLLTHMIAQQCDLDVGEFIWTGGDCHVYRDHIEPLMMQQSRECYGLPRLAIKRKPDSIFGYQMDDFVFEDYQSHPAIKMGFSV